MAEAKKAKQENVAIVRVSGAAYTALKNAIASAEKVSGFAPRPGQIVEAALVAYAKGK